MRNDYLLLYVVYIEIGTDIAQLGMFTYDALAEFPQVFLQVIGQYTFGSLMTCYVK